MGLDMYLIRKTYVQNWDHTPPENRHTVTISGPAAIGIKPERISYIEEHVGYWRKANAIHAWFVRNVMDGNDECREHYVSREQLRELLGLVDTVLVGSVTAEGVIQNGSTCGPETGGKLVPVLEPGIVVVNPELAQSLLPAQSDFFFGSTDYDQYYLDDLKQTKEIIEAVLAEPEVGDLYYYPSW